MTYWDASSLVPLVHHELTSASLLLVHSGDTGHLTLTTTRVEVECALARLLHERRITSAQAINMRNEARKLLDAFFLVPPTEVLIESAVRLARTHPIELRAGDALHLAAWKTVSIGSLKPVEFACNDRRLKTAALAEGATVVP